MLFYIDDENDYNNIPDNYSICVMSNSRILLNRPNSIDLSVFVPNFNFTDREIVNKRRYLNQIKDKERYLVSLFYSNKVSDTEDGMQSNIVFVCDSKDIEYVDYMKIFRKFIKKKYGIKVYKLTYDITLDMIENSYMSYEGKNRYIKKLMELEERL